jgi:Cd2+/Zn2+-exporting ATPase
LAAEAHKQLSAHEHGHFAGVQTRLVLTLIGGVLILNAFLADKIFFRGYEEVGAIMAALGAILLGLPIVVSGFKEMTRGRMHMSTLVAIAVLAAFVLADYRVAGIVAFFMLLASLIEEQTAKGARESIEKLMRYQPETAELVSGQVVSADQLKPGDHVRLRPGDRVPADGRIVAGETTVDQATITGESLPADKHPGDEVFAGTHNLTGMVEVEVTRAGEDTTLGKVKSLILQAESSKTRFMQLIDRYAEWYTPVILMVAAIVWVFTKDTERVITVLVVACPCAFVLAQPTAMVAGLTAAARLGILVKDVAHLQEAGEVTAMVFDKTGTLTTGELTVTRLSPAEGVDGAELLQVAASLDQHSRHPIAQAVVNVARKANVKLLDAVDIQETAGKGMIGTVGGHKVILGRSAWLEQHGVDVEHTKLTAHQRDIAGLSTLYVARDGKCIGWIGLEDKARAEAKNATSQLRKLGVRRLTMITGDRWSVAKKVAGELGCTEVQAECLPEQKLQLVEAMRREGNVVAVVGDGVNDAPALAAGDLGIAMGAAGSDVAISSASIALMSNDLERLPILVRLSRRLRGVIVQNVLVGAVFVIGGATLASMGYFGPIVAAVLHNVSSFIVIFNSARLVRFEEQLTHVSQKAVPAGPQPAAV